MDFELVLAPVDGSDEAEQAVECAMAIANRYDADLHLLYVVHERVLQGLAAGDVNAESVAENHRAFTDEVRQRLDRVDLTCSSTPGFLTDQLSRTPGSAILDAAEELSADFLVVPRETADDDIDRTLGKAAHYILQYADQPVLSV